MTQKKRMGRGRNTLAVFLLLLLFVLLAGIIFFRALYGKLNVDLAHNESGILNPSGISNILLIGVDNDFAGGMDQLGNADGLIIASINEKSGRIVLTSLMRDVRVQVPEGYRTKLTLVYHEGGVPLLIDTIEQNFDITIDSYVLVNYLSVIQIVDAVGGITLELSSEEVHYMDEKIQNLCIMTGEAYEDHRIRQADGGTITLNGLQTAAYLRVRYAGNADFERTERARSVLMALRGKVKDMGLSEFSKLTDTVLPCITTDMSPGMLLSLGIKAPLLSKYEVISERIPVDGSFWFSEENYGSFVDIDFDLNCEHLKDVIYG